MEGEDWILGHRSWSFFISIPLNGNCEASILYIGGNTFETRNLNRNRKME